MIIGDFDLAQKVLIIAEIGNNHEGDLAQALKLVNLANESGADAVKFQTIVPEKLVSSQDPRRLKQLKSFQLTYEDYKILKKEAESCGLIFLSTPFDLESAGYLDELVPAYKIASSDNNFWPLLRCVAKKNKPLLISTGLMSLEEIGELVNFFKEEWKGDDLKKKLALLHCVVNYPTELTAANLSAIEELKVFGVTIGYSDHTVGIETAKLAAAMGARIVEKHFTSDKNYSEFRDHQLSADPEELSHLVKEIRRVESILGCGKAQRSANEKEMIPLVRRSIAAKRDVNANHSIQESDLMWVRPGEGFPPGSEEKVIGKKTTRALRRGEIILEKDFE